MSKFDVNHQSNHLIIINDFGRHFMVNKGHFNGLDKIYPEMLL